jgi:hypothetical protein
VTALDDRRIARMRTAVMEAVEEDIATRGRRARIATRVVAGLCVLAVVAGLGSLLVGGHGSSSTSSTASVPSGLQHRAPVGGEDSAVRGGVTSGAAAGAAPSATSAPGAVSGAKSGTSGRSVIATGTAQVLASAPLTASDTFIGWVDRHGGRIDGETDTGSGRTAHVTLDVRVPDATAAISQLRDLGTVKQVRTSADDVTTQATDLDARIKEARVSIRRLEAIVTRTATLGDLLRAENALTSRQQQLESMVEQRRRLSDQVALATLRVSFAAKAHHAVVVRHREGWFHRTWRRSLHAFGVAVRAIVAIVAFLLPWAVLAALIALVWAGVARLARRRASS